MSNILLPIDRVKPEVKPNEYLCDGCWAVATKEETNRDSWMFFRFKHLKSVWMCGSCKHVHAPDLSLKQLRGL